MVAALNNPGTNALDAEQQKAPAKSVESKNRVLDVLMRRLGSSKSFGENMIFMLNRASE